MSASEVRVPPVAKNALRAKAAVHNAKARPSARVSPTVLATVYVRGVEQSRSGGPMLRERQALKRVDAYLAALSSNRPCQDSDLYPRRTALVASLADAAHLARELNAVEVRALIASAALYSDADPRRAFNLNRALARSTRDPQLFALTDALTVLVADGNSSMARRLRAMRQLRDRFGKWIEMGGGIRFKVDMPGVGPGFRWLHGVANGMDVANGKVNVKLEDGRQVKVPAAKVEKIKATLPDPAALRKAAVARKYESRSDAQLQEQWNKLNTAFSRGGQDAPALKVQMDEIKEALAARMQTGDADDPNDPAPAIAHLDLKHVTPTAEDMATDPVDADEFRKAADEAVAELKRLVPDNSPNATRRDALIERLSGSDPASTDKESLARLADDAAAIHQELLDASPEDADAFRGFSEDADGLASLRDFVQARIPDAEPAEAAPAAPDLREQARAERNGVADLDGELQRARDAGARAGMERFFIPDGWEQQSLSPGEKRIWAEKWKTPDGAIVGRPKDEFGADRRRRPAAWRIAKGPNGMEDAKFATPLGAADGAKARIPAELPAADPRDAGIPVGWTEMPVSANAAETWSRIVRADDGVMVGLNKHNGKWFDPRNPYQGFNNPQDAAQARRDADVARREIVQDIAPSADDIQIARDDALEGERQRRQARVDAARENLPVPVSQEEAQAAAERAGVGQAVKDAIKTGDREQIADALRQDEARGDRFFDWETRENVDLPTPAQRERWMKDGQLFEPMLNAQPADDVDEQAGRIDDLIEEQNAPAVRDWAAAERPITVELDSFFEDQDEISQFMSDAEDAGITAELIPGPNGDAVKLSGREDAIREFYDDHYQGGDTWDEIRDQVVVDEAPAAPEPDAAPESVEAPAPGVNLEQWGNDFANAADNLSSIAAELRRGRQGTYGTELGSYAKLLKSYSQKLKNPAADAAELDSLYAKITLVGQRIDKILINADGDYNVPETIANAIDMQWIEIENLVNERRGMDNAPEVFDMPDVPDSALPEADEPAAPARQRDALDQIAEDVPAVSVSEFLAGNELLTLDDFGNEPWPIDPDARVIAYGGDGYNMAIVYQNKDGSIEYRGPGGWYNEGDRMGEPGNMVPMREQIMRDLEQGRLQRVAAPETPPAAQPEPEGPLDRVDAVPVEFDRMVGHRWLLPDGSWVDYDPTDGSMIQYDPETGEGREYVPDVQVPAAPADARITEDWVMRLMKPSPDSAREGLYDDIGQLIELRDDRGMEDLDQAITDLYEILARNMTPEKLSAWGNKHQDVIPERILQQVDEHRIQLDNELNPPDEAPAALALPEINNPQQDLMHYVDAVRAMPEYGEQQERPGNQLDRLLTSLVRDLWDTPDEFWNRWMDNPSPAENMVDNLQPFNHKPEIAKIIQALRDGMNGPPPEPREPDVTGRPERAPVEAPVVPVAEWSPVPGKIIDWDRREALDLNTVDPEWSGLDNGVEMAIYRSQSEPGVYVVETKPIDGQWTYLEYPDLNSARVAVGLRPRPAPAPANAPYVAPPVAAERPLPEIDPDIPFALTRLPDGRIEASPTGRMAEIDGSTYIVSNDWTPGEVNEFLRNRADGAGYVATPEEGNDRIGIRYGLDVLRDDLEAGGADSATLDAIESVDTLLNDGRDIEAALALRALAATFDGPEGDAMLSLADEIEGNNPVAINDDIPRRHVIDAMGALVGDNGVVEWDTQDVMDMFPDWEYDELIRVMTVLERANLVRELTDEEIAERIDNGGEIRGERVWENLGIDGRISDDDIGRMIEEELARPQPPEQWAWPPGADIPEESTPGEPVAPRPAATPPQPAGAAPDEINRYVPNGVINDRFGRTIYKGIRVRGADGLEGTVTVVQQEPAYARIKLDDGRVIVRSGRRLVRIDNPPPAPDGGDGAVPPAPAPAAPAAPAAPPAPAAPAAPAVADDLANLDEAELLDGLSKIRVRLPMRARRALGAPERDRRNAGFALDDARSAFEDGDMAGMLLKFQRASFLLRRAGQNDVAAQVTKYATALQRQNRARRQVGEKPVDPSSPVTPADYVESFNPNVGDVEQSGKTPGVSEPLDVNENSANPDAKQVDFAAWRTRAAEIATAARTRTSIENIFAGENNRADIEKVFGVGSDFAFGDGKYTLKYGYHEVTKSGRNKTLNISMYIYDGDERIGKVERKIRYNGSTEEYVPENMLMRIEGDKRGGGFSSAYNRWMENWYIANGVKKVKVHAAGGGDWTGGYVWSVNGFGWDMSIWGTNPVQQRTATMRKVDSILGMMGRMASTDAERAQITELSKRVSSIRGGAAGVIPTPMELALVGWRPGKKDWVGKQTMRSMDWHGAKSLQPEDYAYRQKVAYDGLKAAEARAKNKQNTVQSPDLARVVVDPVNIKAMGGSDRLQKWSRQVGDALLNGDSLATLPPLVKRDLKTMVNVVLADWKRNERAGWAYSGMDADLDALNNALDAEIGLDFPAQRTLPQAGDALRDVSLADLQTAAGRGRAGAVPGKLADYKVKELTRGEGGVNYTFKVTHKATGQVYFVKWDKIASQWQGQDPIHGANGERDPNKYLAAMGYNGIPGFERSRVEDAMIVMQRVGDNLDLVERPKNAAVARSRPRSPEEYVDYRDPIRLQMLDGLFGNGDRHDGNYQYAQRASDGKFYLIPVDNAFNAIARHGDNLRWDPMNGWSTPSDRITGAYSGAYSRYLQKIHDRIGSERFKTLMTQLVDEAIDANSKASADYATSSLADYIDAQLQQLRGEVADGTFERKLGY